MQRISLVLSVVAASVLSSPSSAGYPNPTQGFAAAVIAAAEPTLPLIGRVLTVGAGQEYATIVDALAAAQNGDTIAMAAGTYLDLSVNVNTDVLIQALDGPVVFDETRNIANGKAYLVVNANVTIDGISFQNATVDDGNGAGIRFESGNLTVRNSAFIGNQEGILTAPGPDATLTVDSSTFLSNGAGDGYTHGIYAGEIKSLTVTNSGFEGTKLGHDVKSRAASTTIVGNTFDDDTTASYAIDLPNGGTALVASNVIAKAATADNTAAIHYGGEVDNPTGSLVVTDNTIVNQRADGIALLNHTTLSVMFYNNYVFGETALVVGGPASIGDNVVAPNPPDVLPLPNGFTRIDDPVFADLLATFGLIF